MFSYPLTFVRSDIFFLVLILSLVCSLLYSRYRLGKANELLTMLMLESSKVILLMNAIAYLWDAFLLGCSTPVFYSTTFFSGGFALAYAKAFVVLLVFLILILAESFFFREGKALAAEFPVFLLVALFATFGAIGASDLMTMALFMEILSYCLFVMPVLYKITNLSLEALLKYFILGSFSSAFLLMGVSLVFASFGTVAYSSLYFIFSLEMDLSLALGPVAENPGFVYGLYLNLGFVFIFSALFFKLGLVPFHYWVRDVYEGAPLPVVAFFATVAKIPGALVLSKLVLLLFNSFWGFSYIFWFYLEAVGVASIFYGTFFAYYQTRVKSLLAVSSIINMGYFCLALSLHSLLGLFVAFSYLFTYCFTTLGLFFVLLSFSTQRGSIVRLTDVAVVLRTHGLLGWVFALTLLSAAGMPPLPGFFPKLLVMWVFCINGDFLMAFFLAAASVANFILYIRLIRFMYFFNLRQGSLRDRGDLKALDKVFIFCLFLCFFFSVFFGLLLPFFFWNFLVSLVA